tara:strand:+ start:28 stop:513 length:486 start_codon:yes stop_codon:yes gene_type:complete
MDEKLIPGFEINSLKYVNGLYNVTHYSDKNIEIKSSRSLEDVLDCKILSKSLPGNLGKYIFPIDSILVMKDGTKITKLIFSKLLENYSRQSEKINHTDIIFDVPTDKDTVEEEEAEDDESDVNEDIVEYEIDEECEEEEGEWEDEGEEEVDFDDAEPLTEF